MAQLDRIYNILNRNTKGGITAARLAKLAKIAPSNIYKRVSDLRASGLKIDRSYKMVKGRRMVYYNMKAAA